jgi:hypothetical protein
MLKTIDRSRLEEIIIIAGTIYPINCADEISAGVKK